MDVATWLHGLGLQQYEQAFRDNEIDARVLPFLTAEDLKDLGVTLVGHRRRYLDAIATLDVEKPPSAEERAPAAAERPQLTVMFCDWSARPLSPRVDRDLLGGVLSLQSGFRDDDCDTSPTWRTLSDGSSICGPIKIGPPPGPVSFMS